MVIVLKIILPAIIMLIIMMVFLPKIIPPIIILLTIMVILPNMILLIIILILIIVLPILILPEKSAPSGTDACFHTFVFIPKIILILMLLIRKRCIITL